MTSLLASLPRPRRPAESSTAAPAAPAPDLPAAVLALAEAEAGARADALHDGALQALVVARYAADAAVRGGDATIARDAVQDALVTLRRAVWALRPRGERGLRVALEQLAVQVAEVGGPPLHVHVDPTAAELEERLDPAAATAAYRLVQRAAGRRSLTVRVHVVPTGLRLTLDGPLADPAAEALQAQAVGATLRTGAGHAALHLPLTGSPSTALSLTGSSALPLREETP